VEAAGIAVRSCSMFIMVFLFPSYLPLVIMRVHEHAKFALKEEEREKVSILNAPEVSLLCLY
jgi:hypothetical protein